MCTIIIKVFKNTQALPVCHVTSYHNPYDINATSCVNIVSGLDTKQKLTFTYSTIVPSRITDTFFNPEFERHRVTAHQYCNHENVQHMRQMDDVHLVNFYQLALKSRDDFSASFDILLNTKLLDYSKNFLTPQPGDWPAQFHSRQLYMKVC